MNWGSAVLRGALGFAVVSTAAFAVWAYGARWFHDHGGEGAMYAACFAVFILLAGLLLSPRAGGMGRFYGSFFPAFLAYAVLWCVAWFTLRDGAGEWLGSGLGCAAFSGVLAWRLGSWRGLGLAMLILFVTHSAGYFAGEWLYYGSGKTAVDRLLWGVLYGLGFGAGIGHHYWQLQQK